MKRILSLILALSVFMSLFAFPASAATTLKLGWKSATVGIGEVYTFTAKTNSAQKVKWTSSNEKIATVNGGKVTAKATGTAVIKASVGGISKEIKVTVKKAPSKISASNISVTTGRTAQIKVKLPSGTASKGITYKSSKTSIAKVDKNGVVTGVKKGTCNVTVTTFNGKTATVKVTVKSIADKISSGELLYGVAQSGVPMPSDMEVKEYTLEENVTLLKRLGVKSYALWMDFGAILNDNDINSINAENYKAFKDYIKTLQDAGIEVIVRLHSYNYKSHLGGETPKRDLAKGSEYNDYLQTYYNLCKKISELFPEICIWQSGCVNIIRPIGEGDYTIQEQAAIAADMMYYSNKAIHESNPNAVHLMQTIDGGFDDSYWYFVEVLSGIYDTISNGKSISKSKNPDDYFDYLSWNFYYDGIPDNTWIEHFNAVYDVAVQNGDKGKKVFLIEGGYDNINNSEDEVSEWIKALFKCVDKVDVIANVCYFNMFDPTGLNLFDDPDKGFMPTKGAYAIQEAYGGKGDLKEYALDKSPYTWQFELCSKDELEWAPYVRESMWHKLLSGTYAKNTGKITVTCDKSIINADYSFFVRSVDYSAKEIVKDLEIKKGDPRITVSGNTLTLDVREYKLIGAAGFTVWDKKVNSGVKSITLDVAFDDTESKTLLPFLRTAVSNGLLPDSQAKKFKNQITRNDFDEFIMPLLERKLGYDFDISKILGSAYTSLKSGDKVTKEQAVKLFSKAASAMGYKGKTDSLISGSGTFTRGDCVMAMVGLFELVCKP